MSNEKTPIVIGLIVWMVLLFFYLPYTPFAHAHVHFLLMAAPLWLIPLCFSLLGFSRKVVTISVAAGVCCAVAYSLPQGNVAALFTLPWLLMSLRLAYVELLGSIGLSMTKWIRLAAFIFLVVGASWLFVDRLGFRLMGFDAIIILLTAVHFHYAGFLLTILYYFVVCEYLLPVSKIISIGLLSGAPLVAIGITGSQVGLAPILESLTVSVMALTGFSVGVIHLYLGLKQNQLLIKILWIIGGLCLMGGMTLAMLYGWRAHHTLSFLSIPWMYVVHGTLNAIGFAIPVVLGWALFFAKRSLLNIQGI